MLSHEGVLSMACSVPFKSARLHCFRESFPLQNYQMVEDLGFSLKLLKFKMQFSTGTVQELG